MSEAVVPGCCTQRGHRLPGSWLISQVRETRPFRLQTLGIFADALHRAERARRVGSIHADAESPIRRKADHLRMRIPS